MDQLIIDRLGENFKISLVDDKLTSFTIQNHEFIRISRDSAAGIELPTGYYDKMYAGKTTVMVKRKRRLQETLYYYAIDNQDNVFVVRRYKIETQLPKDFFARKKNTHDTAGTFVLTDYSEEDAQNEKLKLLSKTNSTK